MPLFNCISLIFFLFGINTINTKYVDLTYALHNDVPYHPSVVGFNMTVLSNGTEAKGYWYQVEKVETSFHVGTHFDAPCHFAEGRWCVHDIPFERLIAPLVVIDIRHKAENNSDALMLPEDLEKWEENYGKIPNGSVIVMYSGWGQLWPNKQEYLGTADGDLSKIHFPGISSLAAQWIVNNANVYGVGVDSLSVDYGQNKNASTHRILYAKNIYGLENLANVDKLPAKGAKIYVMPIKIKNASGAPMKAFAEMPDDNI